MKFFLGHYNKMEVYKNVLKVYHLKIVVLLEYLEMTSKNKKIVKWAMKIRGNSEFFFYAFFSTRKI